MLAGRLRRPQLTDMIVLDVDDELGERLELQTAAPEPAGIGEERSGGDARHALRSLAHSPGGKRGVGPGAGMVNEEAQASGIRGLGAERGRARSRHRGQTGQRRTQLGGWR